jgi:hypothetical protein
MRGVPGDRPCVDYLVSQTRGLARTAPRPLRAAGALPPTAIEVVKDVFFKLHELLARRRHCPILCTELSCGVTNGENHSEERPFQSLGHSGRRAQPPDNDRMRK